ncbi:hypothetical protein LXL04_029104 [Taraxacum kok-saghyz]
MNRERTRRNRGVPDVLELMHHIQSRLPVKDAARTSILSKYWRHAWSTIPNLRFHVHKEQERGHMKLVDIDHTLTRYLHSNIQIERFELKIVIKNQESASLVEKWIRSVATKSSLKEISLTIRLNGASLHLPDEIFSGENLTKISVSARWLGIHKVWMTTAHNPKCGSLRELYLYCVRINEEVLHDIFSSCRLLVKIQLLRCSQGLNTIKVKNLHFLQHLEIITDETDNTALEINHVPNLQMLICKATIAREPTTPFNTHSIALGSNMTELILGRGVIKDNASLEMIIKSGLPFLKSFSLNMACWTLGSFHFTCASIEKFHLHDCPPSLVDVVHVKAPKLFYFFFSGYAMPSLLFPNSTLEQIKLWQLGLRIGELDASYFLKLRKALTLSNNNYVHIKVNFNNDVPLHIDIDDLRTRLEFPPALNVQKLCFQTSGDECLWENSQFFDAFFEICHPERIAAWPDFLLKHNNHFCKLMLREVLKKKNNTKTKTSYWPRYLKNVQLERPHILRWENLASSHSDFLDGGAPERSPVEFQLKWR